MTNDAQSTIDYKLPVSRVFGLVSASADGSYIPIGISRIPFSCDSSPWDVANTIAESKNRFLISITSGGERPVKKGIELVYLAVLSPIDVQTSGEPANLENLVEKPTALRTSLSAEWFRSKNDGSVGKYALSALQDYGLISKNTNF